jgi:high-affinity nickel-transport protein
MSLLSVLALGLFLGMRHATDADHVVAVTTLVTRRQTLRSAMLLGAFWGLGHGITVLLVGGAIILLGLAVPPELALSLELGVAVMLIGLGALNLSRASHPIGSTPHEHLVARGAGTAQRFRSLFIGVVHGLAGSAAVALLVLSTLEDAGLAFVYLGIFGAGTIVGMMLLTSAMSIPLAAAARRFGSLERLLGHLTGAVSVAFGMFMVYQIGFVDGLFGAAPTWNP